MWSDFGSSWIEGLWFVYTFPEWATLQLPLPWIYFLSPEWSHRPTSNELRMCLQVNDIRVPSHLVRVCSEARSMVLFVASSLISVHRAEFPVQKRGIGSCCMSLKMDQQTLLPGDVASPGDRMSQVWLTVLSEGQMGVHHRWRMKSSWLKVIMGICDWWNIFTVLEWGAFLSPDRLTIWITMLSIQIQHSILHTPPIFTAPLPTIHYKHIGKLYCWQLPDISV